MKWLQNPTVYYRVMLLFLFSMTLLAGPVMVTDSDANSSCNVDLFPSSARDRCYVILYTNANGRGCRLRTRTDINNLTTIRIPTTHVTYNDRISSLYNGGCSVTVCEHVDFEGRCRTFPPFTSINDLNRHGLNDKISSFLIYR